MHGTFGRESTKYMVIYGTFGRESTKYMVIYGTFGMETTKYLVIYYTVCIYGYGQPYTWGTAWVIPLAVAAAALVEYSKLAVL